MPRAFLTPFVIAGLLFLPSCSSAQEPADKPQVKSECDEVKKIYDEFKELLNKTESGSQSYRKIYLTRAYYLLENPKCFTAVQIAAARADVIIATSNL